MDSLGPVEFEFLVDNPAIMAQLNRTEGLFQNANRNIERETTRSARATTAALMNGGVAMNSALSASIERLRINLAQYRQLAALAMDTNTLVRYNQQIQTTEAEIIRLTNLGRTGLDSVGAAAGRSTNYLTAAWSGLRKLAYVLPGVGVAGIIAFATGPIISYISALFKGTAALNEFIQVMNAANAVQRSADKDAAAQIAPLKLLYAAATDVNKSLNERLDAAQQLRETYPQEFANATTLSIINGSLKDSYNELSYSILETAKSKAALSKITDLEAKNLDAQFSIDKNNNTKAAQIARAQAAYELQLKNQSPESAAASARGDLTYKAPGGFFTTPLGQLKEITRQITNEANKANLPFAQLVKTNNKVEDFLTGYIKTVTKGTLELKDANKLLGENIENFDSIFTKAGSKTDLENIKSALETKIKALAPDDAQINLYRQKINQVEAEEKKYDAKAGAGSDQSILASQKALLEKIAALKAEYASKQKSRDEQELDAINEKFKRQYDDIVIQNKKLDDYLKTHTSAQATAAGLKRINPATLAPDQSAAITNQLGLQDFDYYKDDLAKQKKLYDDFEAYKLKVGSQKAIERFEGDFAANKQSYLDYLQFELTAARIDPNDKSAGTTKRRELLQQELTNEMTRRQQAYTQLLEGLQTYETERTRMTATYLDKRAQLVAAGDLENVKVLDEQYKQQVGALDDANFEKLESVRMLHSGIENMSAESAKRLIADVQRELNARLAAGKITAAEAKKIQALIDKAQGKVDKDLPGDLKKIGQEFIGIANAVGQFDAELGNVLNTVGNVISGVGSIKQGISDFKVASDQKNGLGQAVAGLGIVGSAIGIIATVVTLFDRSKERAEQAVYAADLQLKATEAVNKSLERQLSLTKDIYGPERITSYIKSLKDIAAANDAAWVKLKGRYNLTGDKKQDEEIGRANRTGITYGLVDDFMIKLKASGEIVDLSTKSLEDLQKLMDSGKIDQDTAAIVSSLVQLKQQAIETKNALTQEITGIDFKSLNESIRAVFDSGEISAQNFADAIEKSIRGAFAKSFQTKEIETAMQPFYDQLYDAGLDGTYTQSEIDTLRKSKEAIAAALAAKAKTYEQIIGKDPATVGAGSTNTLAGQIKGITADQANILEGTMHGLQLSSVKTNDILQDNSNTQQAQLAEMKQQTILQMRIAVNTGRTADNTDIMRDSLKNIDTNTSGSLATQLRAAGKYGY